MVSQVSAILYFALSLFYLANGSPIVKTNNGHLFGSSENEANVFYSVPYAQPPVGNMRFQDPVAIGYHGDIHVTNDTGVSCISMSFTCTDEKQCPKFESEDCLYLNVYVPKKVDLSDPTNPPKADLPVLVWIHGGAFAFGSGLMPMYDGRFVSEKSGAIVVSINYRYMPFGFLAMSTGSSSAPGNMGIHDQQLALEWVQENIAAFGGNKQQVTIFGESAGAQSVALHLMSTTSKPLFSNAIMQSNPSTFLFKTAAEAQELGTRLAKR
uniref:Carboxylic ester hydrolase n=1 Tax=Ciona savignyi TaxID=51511 RepID=H2Z9T6_CIOSA